MDRQARRRLFLVILACAVVAVTLAFVPYVRETVYIGRLSSEDSDTRCSALRMLGEMRSVRAVADVVRCATKDADMEVRVTAGWALADIGEPALPRLLHTLESGGPDDRAEAARTLVQVVTRNRSPTAMQPLARALKDPEELVRIFAAKALQPYDSDAQPVVPALLEVVNRSDRTSLIAAEVLFWIDRKVTLEQVVPRLQTMSVDASNGHHDGAKELLAWMKMVADSNVENPAIPR